MSDLRKTDSKVLNLNNIYLENNQNIQYIKHSKQTGFRNKQLLLL